MATGFGKRAAAAVLDSVFNAYPSIYVGLHVGDPGDDGQSGTEVSGAGYARVLTDPADWGAASETSGPPAGASVSNVNAITFAEALAAWGTVDYVSLWLTLAGTAEADYIGRVALSAGVAVALGDVPEIGIGKLTFDLVEVA